MSETASLRDEQARAVRASLVSAAVEVIEAGKEPTMRSVAKLAGVSERTIYRYFTSRDELQAAVEPILRERASAPMPESVDGLEAYARELFTRFDANEGLVRALVTAPWGTPALRHSRSGHLRALERILGEAFPEVPRAERRSAAAGLRVALSGAGWVHLADMGFSLQQAINHARWLIRTVVSALERAQKGNHA